MRSDEFHEGYDAFGPYSLETDNPYLEGTDEWSRWANGYAKASSDYLDDAFDIEGED